MPIALHRNPPTSFLMKLLRSNPLSRAYLLIPMLLMVALTSSLARTLLFRPYSVVSNSTALISRMRSFGGTGKERWRATDIMILFSRAMEVNGGRSRQRTPRLESA